MSRPSEIRLKALGNLGACIEMLGNFVPKDDPGHKVVFKQLIEMSQACLTDLRDLEKAEAGQ